MRQTIYIEHPECLTDEDVAHSLGASKDREPQYYKIISETLSPVSEEFYEYILFPNKRLIENSMGAYMNYLYDAVYFDVNDEELVEKGFVNVEEPDNNESLLNIVKYDKKYGKRNNIYNKNLELMEENEIEFKNLMDSSTKSKGNIFVGQKTISKIQ
jgi:hypothetical protein